MEQGLLLIFPKNLEIIGVVQARRMDSTTEVGEKNSARGCAMRLELQLLEPGFCVKVGAAAVPCSEAVLERSAWWFMCSDGTRELMKQFEYDY